MQSQHLNLNHYKKHACKFGLLYERYVSNEKNCSYFEKQHACKSKFGLLNERNVRNEKKRAENYCYC